MKAVVNTKKKSKIVKEVGFDFRWAPAKVWALDEPEVTMNIKELIWHFDIPFWDSAGSDTYDLTPRQVIENPAVDTIHWQRIQQANTQYPIDIMENKNRWLILDGLHRLVNLYLDGKTEVTVRIIPRSRIPEIQVE